MDLSGAVMDAIKNKTYNLKPVEKSTVKRKVCRDNQDYNIGEILRRRLAMGYGMEEDASSVGSCRCIIHALFTNFTEIYFKYPDPMVR